MKERTVLPKTPGREINDFVPAKPGRNIPQSMDSPVEQILYLQRTVGNQAVQGLFKSGAIQAKLNIGQPNDIYEQEADRIADRVMQMPELTQSLVNGHSSLVQRKAGCSSCGDTENEELVRLKALPCKSPPVTTGLQSQIQSMRDGGQPLFASTRAFFEQRFGRDFSNVRVHSDSSSAGLAGSLNAKAFTKGNDVVFGAGQYSPRTKAGARLLAHELTHVVQQGGGSPAPHLAAGANGLKVRERTSSSPVQRLGDPDQVPTGLSCPAASDSPASVATDVLFPVGSPTLTPAAVADIEVFVARWHETGGNRVVRVDGYASIDGPEPLNWRLSCDRALAVVSELTEPSSGQPGIPADSIELFAQGETSEFSNALAPNRRATISSDISVPTCPPGTKPAAFVAGSNSNTEQTVCVPGPHPLKRCPKAKPKHCPNAKCPCCCPLPSPSHASASPGDICKVKRNATSEDDQGCLFCPDEGELVKVRDKKPANFLGVDLCKRGKFVRIQENFVEDCSPLSITHKTDYPAPDPKPAGAKYTRTDVGVGEKVTFTGSKKGNWTATNGTPSSAGSTKTFRWTAPNRAANTVRITLDIGCETTFVEMSVIEPDNITAEKISEIAIRPGRAGAGMILRFHYHPKKVSFGRIHSKEVSGPATDIEGYYEKNYTRAELWHDSKDTFWPVNPDNRDSKPDEAKDIRDARPYEFGTYVWEIPNRFKVSTETGDGKEFTTVKQIFIMMDDTGRIRILKAGAEVDRTP